jgi:hypothetical protein
MMPTESGVNIQGHYTGLVVGYAVSTLDFSIYTTLNVGESWQIEIPVEDERGRRLITTLQKNRSKLFQI